MRNRFPRLLVFSALALLATSAVGVTYVVPPDEELVRRADAIVIGTAGESHPEMTPRGGVVTVARLEVDQILKGQPETTLRLVEIGGILSDRGLVIPGSPRYEQGTRYLVFLRKTASGEWETYGMQLGQFELESDLRGRLVAFHPGGEAPFGLNEADGSLYVDRYRDAVTFLDFIRRVVASAPAAATPYFIEKSDLLLGAVPQSGRRIAFVPMPSATRADYMMSPSPRWQSGPNEAWVYCCSGNYPTAFGSNPINAVNAVNAALTSWNVAGTSVHYSVSGETSGKVSAFQAPDGANTVLFNDPGGEVSSPAVARGGAWFMGTYPLDGVTFASSFEGDIVVDNNANIPTFINQQLFVAILTHEAGHTLGFRHSDQDASGANPCAAPSPCASPGAAVMAHLIQSPALTLQQWDRDAVNTVYGSGAVCTAPAITAGPSSQTITAGQQANLTVTATGTAPLAYQWYVGASPASGTPVGGAVNATFNPSPTSTTTYSVRVSNACGQADSGGATVTVNAACVAPTITSEPPDQQVTTGSAVVLFVGVTGTTPTVTWYQGTKPDTSHPVGSGASITIPSITATAQFWANVTNGCGSVQSRTATISVTTACVAPNITLVDGGPRSIIAGQSVTLTVQAGGSSLQYQWYRGTQPDLSDPVAGAITATVTVTPAASTSYFVRVSNGCGAQSSSSIAITVTAACVPPAIVAADAQPRTISPGGTVTLTVQATGTGLSYQWYRGTTPGDISNAVPNGASASATDTPSASTSYWVRVTGACGTPQDSGAIAVTVSAACMPPSITAASPDMTISANTAATLSVTAAGDAPLHYQWFRGAVDDTSNPLGADAPTLTTPALFADAQFWVRVTNGCGDAKSRAIAVTVIPARHRAARH